MEIPNDSISWSEYSLRRGAKLAGLAHELRNRRRRTHVDEAQLRSAFRKAEQADAYEDLSEEVYEAFSEEVKAKAAAAASGPSGGAHE